MEALFLPSVSEPLKVPAGPVFAGLLPILSFLGDNRFIAGIALH